MENFYSEKSYVTSAMCDTRFSASISGILDLFQNVQTMHTELMGVDAPTMRRADNAFWVLTKYQLHFHSQPRWRQNVVTTTWPSPPSLAKAERQLLLSDEQGNALVSAKAEWCALDCDSRRIRKLSTLSSYPFSMEHKPERVWEGGFLPIPEKLTDEDYAYSVTIRYSHLDFNGHVNNVKYVPMLADCYSSSFWEGVSISDFEIIYANESREGDLLDVYARKDGNRIVFQGKLRDDGKEIFKALIITK